ncbi:unnamed protein product [Closterium sp. NIES-65]|nr:unnamed protein product [Closterium sp. NIES-65]
MQTVRFFLNRAGLHSIYLSFSEPEHLPTLGACIAHSSPSLTSLHLQLQSTAALGFFNEENYRPWALGFLKECAQLRELNLGWGMWDLGKQSINVAWLKSVGKLTLYRVLYRDASLHFLESIAPQLTEFTLTEDGDLQLLGPSPVSDGAALSFPNARFLRLRFARNELKLTLKASSTLKTFSVVAKRLDLSCKSTGPLALDHLLLYGQERLAISSLPLASVKVAYLDGLLRFLFFPSCKWQEAPTPAALQQHYPALAL